ncbi:hypothetical protein ACSJG5_25980, partial [Klebsiella pneumoniae]
MDSVHHIWCPLSSQEFQDLPDGAETTLTHERAAVAHEFMNNGQSGPHQAMAEAHRRMINAG